MNIVISIPKGMSRDKAASMLAYLYPEPHLFREEYHFGKAPTYRFFLDGVAHNAMLYVIWEWIEGAEEPTGKAAFYITIAGDLHRIVREDLMKNWEPSNPEAYRWKREHVERIAQ